MLNGHNRNALDRGLLVDAVEASLILLAQDYPSIPTVERTVVQRLDVVRNFTEVQSSHRALTALSQRHVPYAIFNEPRHRSDGTMQSLLRGSKREYLVRGYDKQHELLEHARIDRDKRELLLAWARQSAGMLRFELQLRAPLLRRKGLMRMSDLTPGILDGLAREYFQRARWEAPYGGPGRVQRTLEELRPNVSRADYRNLCCYLYWIEHGMDVELSANVLERVRPLARKHNLLDGEDDGDVRRLDFDSGRELPAG